MVENVTNWRFKVVKWPIKSSKGWKKLRDKWIMFKTHAR